VIAIRQPDGKVNLKQSISLVGVGATSGGLAGAMCGTLSACSIRLAGMAVGGLVGEAPAPGAARVRRGDAAVLQGLLPSRPRSGPPSNPQQGEG
jgi:hypothetical protein